MMEGHAGTCIDAPWLSLHWHCVLVKLHPIWNLDSLEFCQFSAEKCQVRLNRAEAKSDCLGHDNERSFLYKIASRLYNTIIVNKQTQNLSP